MNTLAERRVNMVNSQIRPNKTNDEAVTDALLAVARERFVPKALAGIAYIDEDIHIGEGRYLMEPMIFARLVQAAEIGPEDLILDVGCATGYSSAVLARLGGTVVALEVSDDLADQANALLTEMGIDNAAVMVGELPAGLVKQGPYDVIMVNGRIARAPEALLDQLADGGRLVAVEEEAGMGRAIVYRRHGETIARRELFDANVMALPGFAAPAGFEF